MDCDGYPEPAETRAIANWSIHDPIGVMAYIEHRWAHANAGYWARRGAMIRASTAGWSGNEDLIGALTSNPVLWMRLWYASFRGGHHYFELPDQKE